jgi:hypothetical protein
MAQKLVSHVVKDYADSSHVEAAVSGRPKPPRDFRWRL